MAGHPETIFTTQEEQAEYMRKHLMGPVDGIFLPATMPGMPSWQIKIDQLRQMKLRTDDVMLFTFPKSGTHWLWEVITMLRHGRSEPDPHTKVATMMDYVDVDVLDRMSSPRTLNTHLTFRLLPSEEVRTRRGVKAVHVYRNPKDVAVSCYHMMKASQMRIAPYPLDTFHEFVQYFFTDKTQIYGTYFDYMKQMHQFQEENAHVPFYNMAFEDMKKEPMKCVKELAKFLELDVSDELCAKIADACSFQNMKSQDEHKLVPKLSEEPEMIQGIEANYKKNIPPIYRKGEIGDWTNHFSVGDSRWADDIIEREMKGIPYTLTFE